MAGVCSFEKRYIWYSGGRGALYQDTSGHEENWAEMHDVNARSRKSEMSGTEGNIERRFGGMMCGLKGDDDDDDDEEGKGSSMDVYISMKSLRSAKFASIHRHINIPLL